jgi:FkbM family methyltransferase
VKLKKIIRRLRKKIKFKFLHKGKITVELSDIAEKTIKFNTYNPVEHYRIAQYGGEREALSYFLSLLRSSDIVYDIGASVGLYTVATATYVKQGKVYAFEPDPETQTRLEENVKINKLSNVTCVKWAVSDQEGKVMLYTDGAAGYAPSMMRQRRKGSPKRTILVAAHSLDTAIQNGIISTPSVIKIDIEGAEGLCLQGAKQLLGGRFGALPRVLFIELHPTFLLDFNTSAAEVRKVIREAGYRLQWKQTRDEQEHLCYVVN